MSSAGIATVRALPDFGSFETVWPSLSSTICSATLTVRCKMSMRDRRSPASSPNL